MFHIVLYNPMIPPNTGNIIRLSANVGFHLHIIEPMGFEFEEKALRRAGLDYHDLSRVSRHESYVAFMESVKPRRTFAITTKGQRCYSEIKFSEGDALVFGSETSGLPDKVMDSFSSENRLRIPMYPNNRSLNLSNSVAIVTYEAWRQHGFQGSIDRNNEA